jgi:carbonic anhydrase/acetyltransferase-like protein (isoleucine patch superfamily)
MEEVTTDKKYELTDETLEHNGHTLHRIRAIRDFGSVKSGQLGGFVESEYNLGHFGNCWIRGNAKVYDSGRVREDAYVQLSAEVFEGATVTGEACVDFDARVYGKAVVTDHARISGHAKVYGDAYVSDHALVSDYAEVFGNASLFTTVYVYEHATVCGTARIYRNAKVCGHATITDGDIHGHAKIDGDAVISNTSDYIVFKNWWSSGRYFTWTRSNNKWTVGCFYGTGEELIKKAKEDSPEKGREYERVVRYVESILANEDPTPSPNAIPTPEPTPAPTPEPPETPSIDEVLGIVDSLEDCSDSEIAKIVYDLATGKMSIEEFKKWTIRISLYIDDDEADHDSQEFSLSDIQNGEADLDSFSLDFYLRDIENRVSDFLSDCISEWNEEDEDEFEQSWDMDCNMGCSHEVRCEISFERD